MAIDDNTSYELTGYQVKDLAQKIRAKADSASLASVATSGLYSDLTGAPTIPTVYNGTLTITQGGNTLGTFTANSSTNETIDIPAGGSSYTAGNGIDITNDTISIDHTVVAELSDLPTVNDATLTITQNGATAGTFTANASSDKTINIETIYADDYISTSPIPTTVTTAMIEDGAVTAAKLDWSSVGGALMYVARFPIHRQTYNNSTLVFDAPSVSVQVDANISVSRVSSNTHLQLDLPTTGVYAANVSTQLWTDQNSWDYMLLELRKNNTGFTRVMAPKIGGSWGFCATQGWTSVSNGDYISEYLNTGGNNFTDGNTSAKDSFVEIVIYRVG